MKQIVINHLSKAYQINKTQKRRLANSLRHELLNFIKNPFSFPTSKTTKKQKIWALANINFAVEKGESLGVIGQNGSGKTTLLKIISGITLPTSGQVLLWGKVSSLLEIGVGFHPDLTGRENIYLNGAILGYSKKEIDKEFDNIVKFSGIEKFIDTPVKYYSSGMYVRLAFSIATNPSLKPDILLLDEILAVGDQAYYKKSLERMENLIKNTKTTILFVSHNLSALRRLCQKCLWLNEGKIEMIGSSKEVIGSYLQFIENRESS